MPSPEPDRLVAGAAHHRHGDLRHGQLARAVQSADAGGGRIRHDRLHLRRPADRRLPGRHADGHLLRLRPEPEPCCATAIYEAHDLVMQAWTEKDTFAFNGRFNQQRYVNIWPRPMQQPHPPIWIPGGGSVETWQWCAEMDYVYCYLSYYGYKAGRATMDGLLDGDGAARQGPQPVPRRLPAVRRRRRKPRAGDGTLRASRPSISTAAACMSIARFATPPGYMTEATQRAGLESQVAKAAGRRAHQGHGDPGTLRRTRDGGHRRQRLRHHRLAGRGRRATARGRRPTSMSAT